MRWFSATLRDRAVSMESTQHSQKYDWERATLDRTAFSVVSSFAESERDDDHYWWAQLPDERLRQIERLRQLNYGHHATARLQRVLEVVQRT